MELAEVNISFIQVDPLGRGEAGPQDGGQVHGRPLLHRTHPPQDLQGGREAYPIMNPFNIIKSQNNRKKDDKIPRT